METELLPATEHELLPPPVESDLQREALLQRVENAGLSALNQMLHNDATVPHSSELLDSILKLCGGVDTFAALLWNQFYNAKAGSPTRTKIITTIVQLTAANTATGGAKKPYRLMDEDELEETLNKRITKTLKQSVPQRITDESVTEVA